MARTIYFCELESLNKMDRLKIDQQNRSMIFHGILSRVPAEICCPL